MKTPFLLITLALLLVLSVSYSKVLSQHTEQVLAEGRQPQIAVDPKGVIRIVYGQENSIYCVTSTDNGATFSAPVTVGSVQEMQLGMATGPQIASSANYSLVSAIDKEGNIYSFKLNHATGHWAKSSNINDVPASAPEGFMSIGSNNNDNFYAVWLDMREDEQNKIAFATTSGKANAWESNRIIYKSPDKTVCECCKPSMHVNGKQVVLMFRNWINGSRDLYFTSSSDGGKNFAQPQKLGTGTWKLKGCPMDGGGIVIDNKNKIHSVWKREDNIFYAQLNKEEARIGKGRNCRINGSAKPVISWKDGPHLKVRFLDAENDIIIGEGSYIETAELADKKTLCVWENEGKLYHKRI